MRALRTILSWLFAISAFSCFGIVVRFGRDAFEPSDAWAHPTILQIMLVPVIFSIMGVVFTMGAWTGFWQKPSCRVWGVAASGFIILTAVFPLILWSRFNQDPANLTPMLGVMAVAFGAGVLGLIAFSRGVRQDEKARAEEIAPRPGDGTNALLNKAAGLIGFALSYAAFTWWIRWVESRDLWTDRNLFLDNVAFFGVLAVIIVVHEVGHAAAGLALGMKLRLFALGPFQLKRSKCKWKFEFSAKLMRGRDGAVGLLPVTAQQPRWHDAVVAGAGPAINLITGAIAIWISETLSNDARLESHGMLALFGAMSVAIGLSSVVPFRLGQYYSDGARFLQHLLRLPFSDLMRIMHIVSAVGETQLRPRDYDIEAIERVLTLYPSGMEGHFLKLYIYDSCFDGGKIAEASQALVEADAIYDSCALKDKTEISFVLGHAGLRSDTDAARRWWERLEARNPDRSESGYWLAKCALDCVEGRPEDAGAALRQADAIIAEMPQTGSRAYDMEWSSLLRWAMQRIPEKAGVSVD
jgi:hypothetical protein